MWHTEPIIGELKIGLEGAQSEGRAPKKGMSIKNSPRIKQIKMSSGVDQKYETSYDWIY